MTEQLLCWGYNKDNIFTILMHRDLTAPHITALFEAFTAMNNELKYSYGIYTFNNPRMTADYLKWLRDK